MSNCPISNELKAWLDGELLAARSQELAHHVESCDSCRRQSDDFRSLSTLIGAALEPAPPSFDTGLIRERAALARGRADGAVCLLQRGAAAAAVLLVSSLLFNVLSPPERPTSPYAALPPDEESADPTRATIDPEYSVAADPVGSRGRATSRGRE